jgi:uncharacterized Zn-binding protein involved in type VI secretion
MVRKAERCRIAVVFLSSSIFVISVHGFFVPATEESRGRMPPAARLTDMHVCPMVTGVVPHVGGPILPPCEPTVLIGGLPAARVTDMALCVGPPDVIAMGSTTVLIGNLMATRIGDMTVHGGVIVLGCPTVIIGG